jgi:Na+/proline symporter
MWIQNVELFAFISTLVTFLTALALLCWRRVTWQTWGAGLLAGVIWLTNWYAPILIWFSVLLALFAIGALFLAHLPVTREQATKQDAAPAP